jgi:hypothetical protein
MKNLTTLTIENARTASTIINKANPEWGTKRFDFDNSKDRFHSFGSGCNSALLFESEFHFWEIASYKN